MRRDKLALAYACASYAALAATTVWCFMGKEYTSLFFLAHMLLFVLHLLPVCKSSPEEAMFEVTQFNLVNATLLGCAYVFQKNREGGLIYLIALCVSANMALLTSIRVSENKRDKREGDASKRQALQNWSSRWNFAFMACSMLIWRNAFLYSRPS